MKRTNKLIVLLFALSMFSCNSNAPSSEETSTENGSAIAENVGVEEFRELIKSPGVILDVRTPEEYEGGMIEGAINIDYMADDFSSRINELDKNVPVYVYCASGGRSSKAMSEMTSLGFKKVYNLLGGYRAWK